MKRFQEERENPHTDENIKRVRKFALSKQYITRRMIAEELNSNLESVHSILKNDLKMQKLARLLA